MHTFLDTCVWILHDHGTISTHIEHVNVSQLSWHRFIMCVHPFYELDKNRNKGVILEQELRRQLPVIFSFTCKRQPPQQQLPQGKYLSGSPTRFSL